MEIDAGDFAQVARRSPGGASGLSGLRKQGVRSLGARAKMTAD
jgi:hypothetical protein